MTALNQLPAVQQKEPGEVIAMPQQQAAVPAVHTPLSPFGSIEAFETAQRMATALASSTFVPKEFKGNIGDCLILLETASRTCMPIMALMQNMYVVHGKPSFSSAFMAGLINNAKRFDAPLQFKYNKARTSCYAHTTKDGQEYRGITVTVEMAQKEGWSTKKGSKWVTMPELMLQYRATSFFARAYCADLIMGMREQHEVEDAYVAPEQPAAPASNLNTVISPTKEEKEQAIDAEVEEIVEEEPVDPPKKTKAAAPKKQPAKKAAPTKKTPPAAKEPEVASEQPANQLGPNYKKMMDEAIEKKTATELDQWRMKHQSRILKMIPDREAQASFFTEIEGLYQSLKEQEAEDAAEQEAPILCPQSGREMNRADCLESSCYNGCPAL